MKGKAEEEEELTEDVFECLYKHTDESPAWQEKEKINKYWNSSER